MGWGTGREQDSPGCVQEAAVAGSEWERRCSWCVVHVLQEPELPFSWGELGV